MGIRDKEKSRQEITSNVGAIIGETSDNNDIKNEKLKQKSYYITEEQYYNLRLLSVKINKDMSCLVREILDKYFAENPQQ